MTGQAEQSKDACAGSWASWARQPEQRPSRVSPPPRSRRAPPSRPVAARTCRECCVAESQRGSRPPAAAWTGTSEASAPEWPADPSAHALHGPPSHA
eukprot:4399646-Alexandrium_andersonii.AAC.1